MKIISKIIASFALCISALAPFSCASAPASQSNAKEPQIIDWQDKALGQVEKPTWVMQLKWGNDRPFKDAFGVEYTRVCRLGAGNSVMLEQAKELSRLDAASKIARELRQAITAKVANELDDEQLAIVNNAMIGAKVNISGLREEESHWWLVRRYDEKSGKYYNEYEYFTAFSMPKDVWNETAKSYLLSVMKADGVPKEAVGATYSTLQSCAERESEESAREEAKAARDALSRLGESALSEFDSGSDAELEAFLK